MLVIIEETVVVVFSITWHDSMVVDDGNAYSTFFMRSQCTCLQSIIMIIVYYTVTMHDDEDEDQDTDKNHP